MRTYNNTVNSRSCSSEKGGGRERAVVRRTSLSQHNRWRSRENISGGEFEILNPNGILFVWVKLNEHHLDEKSTPKTFPGGVITP